MLRLLGTIVSVFSDLLRLGALYFRSSSTIRAENLVPCRQLAGFVERGIKPKRVDFATRVSLALFTRLFDWRDAVGNVRPSAMIRWPPPAELASLPKSESRHRLAVGAFVLAKSVLGGLHHEYSLAVAPGSV